MNNKTTYTKHKTHIYHLDHVTTSLNTKTLIITNPHLSISPYSTSRVFFSNITTKQHNSAKHNTTHNTTLT